MTDLDSLKSDILVIRNKENSFWNAMVANIEQGFNRISMDDLLKDLPGFAKDIKKIKTFIDEIRSL